MIYIYNFFFAIICTVGFGVLFNVPKSSLFKAGLGGGVGWVLYNLFFNLTDSSVLATFVASFAIAVIGEIFAVLYRNPITMYIIPGIVPLVPGYGLYYTMLSIIDKNYDSAATYGSESLLISIAIAGALTIVLSINTFRKSRKPYRKKHLR
ncbi:threonine/serine exporter family protein [Serpentinicella sp. ANB-PHB4]|uniref:threonine/serine exporter family protein n=1 Tax=Serpentinicella sp. ANB-PHB4 TaxID=3074076 RepID=UPI0028641ABA|nr:threonine/serine exporter family protein [Serpentinicella sp. ANB-PHB4]MDR5658077.1 threonine/serine exporter family protein [Serpentinicella sp. ANB-PHB4]